MPLLLKLDRFEVEEEEQTWMVDVRVALLIPHSSAYRHLHHRCLDTFVFYPFLTRSILHTSSPYANHPKSPNQPIPTCRCTCFHFLPSFLSPHIEITPCISLARLSFASSSSFSPSSPFPPFSVSFLLFFPLLMFSIHCLPSAVHRRFQTACPHY